MPTAGISNTPMRRAAETWAHSGAMGEQGWLSAEEFSHACRALPLVSIDLVITRGGEDRLELLLGRRNNRPAEGWWFTPGGRIRKNEPLGEALARIAQAEVKLSGIVLDDLVFLGACDHFYHDSAFDQQISTHYVNLPYWLRLDDEQAQRIEPPVGAETQHSAWRWIALDRAAEDPLVHENVRRTLKALLTTASS